MVQKEISRKHEIIMLAIVAVILIGGIIAMFSVAYPNPIKNTQEQVIASGPTGAAITELNMQEVNAGEMVAAVFAVFVLLGVAVFIYRKEDW
ncbi:hypothetical protein JW949_01185 [Candidatus Woesearchaeota archaeon]|nr:hypothetical protein [Candidatus Woesearchaeota archaeon]